MSQRTSVLLIPDTYGWAWHHMAKGIATYSPPPFRVQCAMPPDVSPLSSNHLLGHIFGTVMQMSLAEGHFPLRWSLRDASLIDHPGWFWSYDDSPYVFRRLTSKLRNRDVLLKRGRRCDVLLVKNERHYAKAMEMNLPAAYVPPAVDRRVFQYQEPADHEELIVGWCGQVPNGGERNQKGYHEVLVPLIQATVRAKLPIRYRINTRDANRAMDLHDMVNFYASCDVFLCTSMDEGGPQTILEAMSCGRPVISTECGFAPEVIQHGETGWLVERWYTEQDAEQTVQSLVELLVELVTQRDRLCKMGIEASNRVHERWTWEKNAKAWLMAMSGVSDEG